MTRPHTVFAGHVHHYVQYDRNGMKYYHLATTGGGSRLRGMPYGEFDHVAWLTMEPEGPTVVNLLLDGIVPADTVTEKGIARFRDFLAKTRLEVAPILVDDEDGHLVGPDRSATRRTRSTSPVEITAEIDGLPLRGLSVEPSPVLKLTAAPGETTELSVDVRFAEKIAFSQFAQTLLTAKIRTLDEEHPLTGRANVPVVIDRKYLCPRASEHDRDRRRRRRSGASCRWRPATSRWWSARRSNGKASGRVDSIRDRTTTSTCTSPPR